MAMTADREDEALGRPCRGRAPMAVEGGDAEDDRRHEGDAEALEQVGGHAGAVADVVAHVVGDGGRVAGVVLGDAGLDLADQVGADVGGLGEDAAADPQEQGQQRATEAEADEDGGRGVLEQEDDHGGAEQAEAGGGQADDAAGAEGDHEGGGEVAADGGGGGAHVASGGQPHAEEADGGREHGRRRGTRACGRSPDSAKPRATVAVGLLDLGRGEEDHDRQRDHDHGDGAELAA